MNNNFTLETDIIYHWIDTLFASCEINRGMPLSNTFKYVIGRIKMWLVVRFSFRLPKVQPTQPIRPKMDNPRVGVSFSMPNANEDFNEENEEQDDAWVQNISERTFRPFVYVY